MGIVAMIGLIFGPFVSLLFAAWFYVRWQNEEDEELAPVEGGYLVDGAQKPDGGAYGQSITDPCLGWEKTERLIYEIADRL